MSGPAPRDRSGQYRHPLGYPTTAIDPSLAMPFIPSGDASRPLDRVRGTYEQPRAPSLFEQSSSTAGASRYLSGVMPRGNSQRLRRLAPKGGIAIQAQRESSTAVNSYGVQPSTLEVFQRSLQNARHPQSDATDMGSIQHPYFPNSYHQNVRQPRTHTDYTASDQDELQAQKFALTTALNEDVPAFKDNTFVWGKDDVAWQQRNYTPDGFVHQGNGHGYGPQPMDPDLIDTARFAPPGYPTDLAESPFSGASTLVADDDLDSYSGFGADNKADAHDTSKPVENSNEVPPVPPNTTGIQGATEANGDSGRNPNGIAGSINPSHGTRIEANSDGQKVPGKKRGSKPKAEPAEVPPALNADGMYFDSWADASTKMAGLNWPPRVDEGLPCSSPARRAIV
jgi:hypothetical protein